MSKPIRTRISWGPSCLWFSVTYLLALAATFYTQANLLFWAFGLMTGAIVASFCFCLITLRHVTVKRLLPMHGLAHEQLTIRYNIQNNARLSLLNLTVTELSEDITNHLPTSPIGWLLYVGSAQHMMAEAPCWPKHRGPLHFQKIQLACSFPFGILKKTVTFEQPDYLLIYPRIFRLNRRIAASISRITHEGNIQKEKSGGTEDYFGLREYHTGDSIRMINWKQSAKTGNLIVKEMTQPCPPQTMINLNLTPPDATDLTQTQIHSLQEQAISLVGSVICDAYTHGYPVGLTIPALDITFPLHHSLPHRTKILESLAQIELSSIDSDAAGTTDKDAINITTHPLSSHSSSKLTLSVHDINQYITDQDVSSHDLDQDEQSDGGAV
ncbi:hypothetical protein KS4_25860 [Poriferisphaera corsica]|uniref:DUF58 domain-containing protein n=1 Tax=Poriferisphaera corsica TaxID=2528020 RepID=A0A517YWC8_9BACT|nr:DUF58 domain-containing protein [Poriferisphaera corsica]QDU34516.1 hypothetical protein KS4_25860 [Poriferisphaera corsica]